MGPADFVILAPYGSSLSETGKRSSQRVQPARIQERGVISGIPDRQRVAGGKITVIADGVLVRTVGLNWIGDIVGRRTRLWGAGQYFRKYCACDEIRFAGI